MTSVEIRKPCDLVDLQYNRLGSHRYFCGALGPVLLAIVAAFLFLNRDLLSGFTENNSLGPASMQFAVGAFCLTGGYKTLIDETKVSDDHFDPRKPGIRWRISILFCLSLDKLWLIVHYVGEGY